MAKAQPKPWPDVASLAREDLLSRAAVTLTCTAGKTSLLPPRILHNHCLQFLLRHEDVPREI